MFKRRRIRRRKQLVCDFCGNLATTKTEYAGEVVLVCSKCLARFGKNNH